MRLHLHVWRQPGPDDVGRFETFDLPELTEEMSVLEVLDIVNEQLVVKGREPIVFDHDCREGICGSCSLVINGRPHGPGRGTTSCQTFLRGFADGSDVYLEPFRAAAFPLIKDLMVDRGSLDRIVESGGYISANTGGAPDGNALPIAKYDAEGAMDAAACIGCGACVAACKNASAMLFTGAKVSHLSRLPQGQTERAERVNQMVLQMDSELFGSCTNQGACSAVCPKEISLDVIGSLNREYAKAQAFGERS